MSDLVWVAAGFSLVYSAMIGYTAALDRRLRRARRRAEQLR
jgi:hypothetical protein